MMKVPFVPIMRRCGAHPLDNFYRRNLASSWKNFTIDEDLTTDVKKSIEKKWWDQVYGENSIPETQKRLNKAGNQYKYVLSMFPYPSGNLHLGHVRVYTLSDVLARFHRMNGFNVIHPMGWDAFGLPAENAARDNSIDPETWTRENIKTMKDQIISMGCHFDWDRELATCDKSYYKWTQWLFLKLWEEGLAYRKQADVYFDPIDNTVLALEQIDNEMKSWRSGAKVEKRLLKQWFVRTTEFAESLSNGLSSPELVAGWRDIISLQKHWIGDIKGHFYDTVLQFDENISKANCDLSIINEPLRIWLSSPGSLDNCRYVILKEDSPLFRFDQLFIELSSSTLKGLKLCKGRILTGNRCIPVLTGSTGSMPIIPESADGRVNELLDLSQYENLGARDQIFEVLDEVVDETKLSEFNHDTSPPSPKFTKASLKLRDWLVSRQRKWGTPIPMLNCLDCNSSTPIKLRDLPYSSSNSLSGYQCDSCGSINLTPESDTLDTFFDSSWYFYRYLDPKNSTEIFEKTSVNPYLPVDTYVGGKEHATLHLYYARFMAQFLKSLGLISVSEPFKKLIPVGVVMGETYYVRNSEKCVSKDLVNEQKNEISHKVTGEPAYKKWEKMSKSKFNGIDPASVIEQYGVDSARLLSMSEAVPTSARKWPSNASKGFLKWQNKMWEMVRDFMTEKDFTETQFMFLDDMEKWEDHCFDCRNYYLKGITYNYNVTSQISVVISKMQGLQNSLRKVPKSSYKESIQFERALGALIISMYPVLPSFSAQLWQSFRAVASLSESEFNLEKEVWEQPWPEVDYNYKMDLICKFNHEEICTAKVERHCLESMDAALAYEFALDEPKFSEKIAREEGEVLSFTIQPEYRAIINIRRKAKAQNPGIEEVAEKKLADKKMSRVSLDKENQSVPSSQQG